MSSPARNRHRGLWVPVEEVSAWLACGWRLVIEEVLAGGTHPDGRVLLEPPAWEEQAA